MKTNLLILSTESTAQVLHDLHSSRLVAGTPDHGFVTWRGKVGKPEHAEECQHWRDLAENFFEQLMNWANCGAVPAPSPAAVNTSSPPPMSEAAMDRLDLAVVGAQLAERAARLQTELDRVRKHETHLIQDRDRLIHGDLARLNKQAQALIVERDDARGAASRFSERLVKTEGELMASQDRVRILTERLAAIASLTSDASPAKS